MWLRRPALAVLCVLSLGGAGPAGLLSAAGATSSFTVTRLAGTNRFATAAAIAEAAFPAGSSTVVLASGSSTNFADSLAAGYLAA